MIKIMADSTCDLPQDIIEKYNIGVAPLNIIIDGKSYRDKIDLTTDEFFKLLEREKDHPTTSMPSPDEYMKIFHQAVEEGHKQILCICMSSGTSGSYQSAVIAKDFYFEQNENSHIEIYIVDTLSMSHGSGWLIMKTAELREEGYTFQQLIEFNEKYKTNVKHLLCVDDLDNLIKSGRLSNASAFIGKILRIQPIMSMKKGRGAIIAKERGKNRVLKFYIDEFVERVNLEITNFVIVGYTTDIRKAEELVGRLRKDAGFKGEIYIMQMGVAVGTHVGKGGLSMFFLERDKLRDGLIKNEIRHLLEKKDEIVKGIKNK